MSKPIIMLDLNYTLVENCDAHPDVPFAQRIQLHRYRQWLVELVRPYRVFILTARPAQHEAQTYAHIKAQTGWVPERYYGNTHGLPPPLAKQKILIDILDREFGSEGVGFGSPTPFLGIESNPRTRAMYSRFFIPSIPCTALNPNSNLTHLWQSLATGPLKTSP
jgi:hypothetical protein